jgi:hypothetical protein
MLQATTEPRGRLGITYEKCVGASPENPVADRWRMLGESARLLPEKRVADCSQYMVPNVFRVEAFKSADSGKAFFGNLKRCGSVWDCPVCAAKITEKRRKELKQGLTSWVERGNAVYLLTLTVPHHAGNDVRVMCSQLLKALKFLQNRTHWRAFRFAVGLRGTVRALEVTYGLNGAHVHVHILLFCDGKRKPERADLLSSWQKACESAGLPEPNEHGVDIRDGTYAAKYVGKWGLDCEMTKAHVKRGNGSGRTPWDLLRASMSGETYAGYLFQRHSAAFFRKRQLVWSRGLRAELGLLQEEKSDEAIANEKEETATLVTTISFSDWQLVLRYNARAEVLVAAEKGGAEAVERLLIDLREVSRKAWSFKHVEMF